MKINSSQTLHFKDFTFFRIFEFEKIQLSKRISVYHALKKKKPKTTYFTKKVSNFQTPLKMIVLMKLFSFI